MARVIVQVCLCLLCAGCGNRAWAAQAAPAASADTTRATPAFPGVRPQSAVAAKQPLPPKPGDRSPIDTFRDLLAMEPAERAKALAGFVPEKREYIEAGLRRFDGLSAVEREIQLRQLDLRYYLTDLAELPPAIRAQRLAGIRADLRPILEARLKQLDSFPPEFRNKALSYESTANYFVRVPPPGEVEPDSGKPLFIRSPSQALDPQGKAPLEQFLKLPAKEQQLTLEALPPAERAQMQKTLSDFERLPPIEREICINSFEKLSRMSKAERDQFLKNAARWKSMSPAERETWRTLINILPPTSPTANLPPMPPGFGQSKAALKASSVPSDGAPPLPGPTPLNSR